MHFKPTTLQGAILISLDLREDERGYYARTYCEREFAEHGLPTRFVQSGVSFNERRGILRGLHFQRAPAAQAKIVRCIRGAAFDVMLDLRPQSPTYRRWEAIELTADNHLALYLPKGFAHGFQALSDATEIHYDMDDFYDPKTEGGVRWNDPQFQIPWPIARPMLSDRDQSWPDYAE